MISAKWWNRLLSFAWITVAAYVAAHAAELHTANIMPTPLSDAWAIAEVLIATSCVALFWRDAHSGGRWFRIKLTAWQMVLLLTLPLAEVWAVTQAYVNPSELPELTAEVVAIGYTLVLVSWWYVTTVSPAKQHPR